MTDMEAHCSVPCEYLFSFTKVPLESWEKEGYCFILDAVHSLFNIVFCVLLRFGQQTRDQEDPLALPSVTLHYVRFTPYPAPNDHFFGL